MNLHKNRKISNNLRKYFSVTIPIFEFFTIFVPICIIATPMYWINITLAPCFQIFAFILFGLPSIYILKNPFLRNPFFVVPFTCCFIVALGHNNWQLFLKDFILIIGLIELSLGIYRTYYDWQKVLLVLNSTKFFRNFFECETFWRVCVLTICPILIPLLWVIFIYFPW